MNNNRIKMLFILCVLMLALLLVEWNLMRGPETSGTPPPQISNKQIDSVNVLPKLKMAALPIEEYVVMVESPLFIEGRKPIDNNSGADEPVTVGKIDDLVLIGIFSVKEKLFALFSQKKAQKKFSKINVGEEISGWQLKEIKMDSVVLESDGKEQTVLLRKPRKVLKTKKRPRVRQKDKVKLNPFSAALEKSKRK